MKTLVVQRGHYPRTTGATGTAGEQQAAVEVSERTRALTPAGWQVRLINADEPDSAYRGDAFVALHCDGSSNSQTGGASVGFYPAGAGLAKRWKAAYGAVWPHEWLPDNYTTNLAHYYGTRKANEQGNTDAIIVELGFLTNPTERDWISKHHDDIAASVWKAVAGEAAMSDYIYVNVVHQGDEAHVSALKALAAQYQDRADNGVVASGFHAAAGENADAYIAYAKAHGLECHSITNGLAATMVTRSLGTRVGSSELSGCKAAINTAIAVLQEVAR